MIHILLPTRGRVVAALECIGSIYATASDPSHIKVHVGVDAGDPAKYEAHLPNVIRTDSSSSAACLSQLWDRIRFNVWCSQLVMIVNDDCRFETPAWDHIMRFSAWQPNSGTARLLYPNDMIQGANLATFPCMTLDFIEAIGGRIPPAAYRHLYADTELHQIAKAADALVYVPSVIVRHLHHSVTGKSDETSKRIEQFEPIDRAIYDSRKDERAALALKVKKVNGV